MPEIVLRLPRSVYDSPFCQGLLHLAGQEHSFFDTKNAHKNADYFGPIHQAKHAAVWRYYHSPHAIYVSGKNNVLFVDESIARPGEFLFIDRMGFGGYSSIVIKGENLREISAQEQMSVTESLEALYPLFQGKRKDGPIVVAIYTNTEAIHACHEMLPSTANVLFLRPPSLKTKFAKIMEMYLKKNPNWSVYEGQEKIEDIIGSSRALVTNLDRPAFVSVAMAIPTATLGRGLWSGSRCTLDCTEKPRLLRTLMAYDFDEGAAYPYLASILRFEVSRSASSEEIAKNENVASWLSKAKNAITLEQPA